MVLFLPLLLPSPAINSSLVAFSLHITPQTGFSSSFTPIKLKLTALSLPPSFRSQLLLSSSASSPPKWKAHCFPQPITHFPTTDPSITNETFCQRYWFNPEHYQPGGPVIVLDGGETSGANRLPFLETGILDILARVSA